MVLFPGCPCCGNTYIAEAPNMARWRMAINEHDQGKYDCVPFANNPFVPYGHVVATLRNCKTSEEGHLTGDPGRTMINGLLFKEHGTGDLLNFGTNGLLPGIDFLMYGETRQPYDFANSVQVQIGIRFVPNTSLPFCRLANNGFLCVQTYPLKTTAYIVLNHTSGGKFAGVQADPSIFFMGSCEDYVITPPPDYFDPSPESFNLAGCNKLPTTGCLRIDSPDLMPGNVEFQFSKNAGISVTCNGKTNQYPWTNSYGDATVWATKGDEIVTARIYKKYPCCFLNGVALNCNPLP